jgi:polyferredoxin
MVTATVVRSAPTEAGTRRGPFRKKHLRRWRVASLLGIHVLFALHLAHWKLRGATVAPLEFSESLHTLHDGIITAGFVFALLAVAGTLVFGRFFCGWGCHILALQDGCAWLLGKLGIRPKPVRSRTMALIPLGIMAYIYIWPQMVRLWERGAYPGLHLVRAADGWGSFVTRDLFRAMPGPLFSVLTLAVCGGATVYFLGSRSFCYSVCPYGVFFGWAEKVAPAARLVLSGSCESCGLCTLNCKSGVQVIQELKRYGTVTDTNCLKSLDCVAGCPNGAIGLGFRLPWSLPGRTKADSPDRDKAPAKARGKASSAPPKRFDFTWSEELLFLVLFIAVFLIYRGLYETGIFLAGTLGAIAGAGAVRWRKARAKPAAGRGGWIPASVGLAFLALTAHGAYVHYHAYRGQLAFERNPADPESVAHLRTAAQQGLFPQPGVERSLALAAAGQGDVGTARAAFARYLALRPRDVAMRVQFAQLSTQMGQDGEAGRQLDSALANDSEPASAEERPWRATAYSLLAQRRAGAGDTAQALVLLEKALADNPDDASHACNLAFLRLRQG